MSLYELPQRYAHSVFHSAGPVDVPTDAVQLGTAVVMASKASEPLRPPSQYCGHSCNGLNIVDGGRTAIQAHICWVRRLDPGLALQHNIKCSTSHSRMLLALLAVCGHDQHLTTNKLQHNKGLTREGCHSKVVYQT